MNSNQSIKKYPPKKQLLYQELQDLPSKYQVIALSKMNKVRSTQLMTLRKKFHNQINIKIIKNKVAQRAFEEVKVPTKIDQGSIAVTKDTIVARSGEVISQKLASLLSKVNIKPIEAGVLVNYAISEGLQFREQDLQLNVEEYIKELQQSYSSALNLAMEVVYFAPETMSSLLSLAYQKSLNVASAAGYISKETVEIVINKAQTNAYGLSEILKTKGYDNQ